MTEQQNADVAARSATRIQRCAGLKPRSLAALGTGLNHPDTPPNGGWKNSRSAQPTPRYTSLRAGLLSSRPAGLSQLCVFSAGLSARARWRRALSIVRLVRRSSVCPRCRWSVSHHVTSPPLLSSGRSPPESRLRPSANAGRAAIETLCHRPERGAHGRSTRPCIRDRERQAKRCFRHCRFGTAG